MTPSFDASGIQFVWNSTSIKLAEECLRKYQYKMIEGWKPRGLSVHLKFGAHYATALEHYYKHRALGATSEEALRLVVMEALTDTWDRETGPWVSDHNLKTRENLIRTIIWYVDQFEDEAITVLHDSSGAPMVEHSVLLDVDDGLMFAAHIDRMVEYGGNPYVMDQKAQPLSSQVLTPTGWTTIGQLSIGDLVIGRNGKPTEVVGIFDKGITPVYKITFNDRTSVLCAEEHLWTVTDQMGKTETLSMKEIMSAPSWRKFAPPLVKAVDHAEADLPIHPYVLGVLLGDGYLAGKSIQFSSSKIDLVQRFASFFLITDDLQRGSDKNYSWYITGNGIKHALEKLKLTGCLAATKFIPEMFFFSSREQRRALLQGLLDTDGGWNGSSRIYDTMSLQLAVDICQLVRSLGGTARFRNRRDGCFRLSLRMPEWPTGVGKRYMTDITRVADDYTRCIKVAARDGLYVTDNYTVTHNTTATTITAHWFNQWSPDVQMCQPGGTLIRTPHGETPIEKIKEGDYVISYHNDRCLRKQRVIGTAARLFEGFLTSIVAGNSEHKVTPNHRVLMKYSETFKNKYAVYIMRKGPHFRVGTVQISSTREGGMNGISQRCRNEKADAMWVLDIFDTRKEAWLLEQVVSCQFGLPQVTFKAANFASPETLVDDQIVLHEFWSICGDNVEKAKRALRHFGREFDYPIYTTEESNSFSSTRAQMVRACNLFPQVTCVPLVVGNEVEWVQAEIGYEPFAGEVYSLEVTKVGQTNYGGCYVANDIVTGNSMYTFLGKAAFNIPVKGVILDAAQIAVGFSRFERGFTFRTESQLNEWYDDSMYHIERARTATRNAEFPMNRTACSNYGGCEFRGVCSRSPDVRAQWLAADFERGAVFDPLERR
jgi:hypothetical protein